MDFVSDYRDQGDLRKSFHELTETVFGFNLEEWYQHGYWTYRYVPHSYVNKGKVVANVSTYEMDFLLDGQKTRTYQIGTVMIHPDYRGQGLAGKLMKSVMDEYKSKADLIYLFANPSVRDFYQRYGFGSGKLTGFEFRPVGVPPESANLVKLDIGNTDHETKIYSLAKNRFPVSNRCGIINGHDLFMFHCLYIHRDNLYLLDDDILLVLKEKNNTLYLYDIVSPKPFSFNTILPNIINTDTRKVIFCFTPDLLDIEVEMKAGADENLFFVNPIRADFPSSVYLPSTGEA